MSNCNVDDVINIRLLNYKAWSSQRHILCVKLVLIDKKSSKIDASFLNTLILMGCLKILKNGSFNMFVEQVPGGRKHEQNWLISKLKNQVSIPFECVEVTFCSYIFVIFFA